MLISRKDQITHKIIDDIWWLRSRGAEAYHIAKIFGIRVRLVHDVLQFRIVPDREI